MKYKKIMFMLVLAVFLLSITCVSASEIDDTLASEDTNTIGLSVDNDIIEDNLQTSEENDELALTDNDETLSAKNDTDVLSDNSGTYSELSFEIGSGGDIELQHDYYTYDTGNTISISVPDSVIDGKGAIINMTGSNIRAFYVNASGVTIKNLTIINANSNGDGGAIYNGGGAVFFAGKGEVTNCNFTGNTATGHGGAVHFFDQGTVTNCNFINNKATGTNSWGGAVCFYGAGTVTNCNFINNKATGTNSWGGGVCFNINGEVTNCNFVDNSASLGGAIFSQQWYTTADTCIFKRNSGDNVNTVIYPPTLNVDDFTTVYGSGEKLTFDLKTNSSIPVTNGNILISVYFKDNGEWVRNYTCLSGEGWIPDLPVGSYIAVFNTEYAEFQKINRTVTITMPNVRYSINVTSLTTNNKTVNITAKSDIPKDILWDGKLLFILPNSTEISANYGSNGTWWAVHTFDDYGEYNVNASYDGLDNVTTNEGNIKITKTDSTITLNNVIFDYGDSINIATVGAVGITAKINGVDVSVLDNHIIPLAGLNVGTYNLTVTTVPDEDHYSVTMNATITVNPIQTQLAGNSVAAIYKANKYLVITLKDANGNPISGAKLTVDLNGAKTYTTDKNGQVKVSIKALVPKKYSAKVTFNGNANYLKSTKTIKVTVKKATPKLTAKKKTFKKSVKIKKYTITLKYGKTALKKVKVYIKIKGKTYKATTNKKGKATFKIKKLTKKGTFKSKITFKGNKYYNKVTKKVKIKVK